MLNARRVPLIALLLLIACGSQSRQNILLDGDWMMQLPFAGSYEEFYLHQEGETLAGIGRYGIEAGRSGQLQVNGTVRGAQVSLTLERDLGDTATYVAKVEAPNILTGTLTYGSSAPMEGVVFFRNTDVVCPAICVAGACTLSNGRCISSPSDQCSNQCFCEAVGGHWSASSCP